MTVGQVDWGHVRAQAPPIVRSQAVGHLLHAISLYFRGTETVLLRERTPRFQRHTTEKQLIDIVPHYKWGFRKHFFVSTQDDSFLSPRSWSRLASFDGAGRKLSAHQYALFKRTDEARCQDS